MYYMYKPTLLINLLNRLNLLIYIYVYIYIYIIIHTRAHTHTHTHTRGMRCFERRSHLRGHILDSNSKGTHSS